MILGVTKLANRILLTLLIVCSLVVVFIVCDYFALFGLKKYLVLDFIELSFVTRDQDTGAPVVGVRVRCFQKGNDNACTKKKSKSTATLLIRVPVQNIVWHSLLFKNKVERLEPQNSKLHIMFIHPDYTNPIESIVLAEIVQKPLLQHPVTMQRKSKIERAKPRV